MKLRESTLTTARKRCSDTDLRPTRTFFVFVFETQAMIIMDEESGDAGAGAPEPEAKKPCVRPAAVRVHCPVEGCTASCCRRARLNEHLRECHGQEDSRPGPRFVCPACDEIFYHSSKLCEHYDRLHECASKSSYRDTYMSGSRTWYFLHVNSLLPLLFSSVHTYLF